jgi:site-specific recombinase XerD
MAENADLAVPRDPVREYQELMAAIGRMVVGAALLEYSVAVLVAVTDGYRGQAVEDRALQLVRKAGAPVRELVRVLRAHRAQQNRQRLAAASLWEDFGVVFAQENGRPLDPRADWQEWSDILAAAGVRHAGTHAMRHLAATIGLDQGTALAVAQELLGHSDIRVTRGYTHVSAALAADGAERIGRTLFGTK